MNATLLATIYGYVLHLAGIVVVAILIATSHLSVDVGLPILTGLVGLGINTSPQPGATTAVTTGAVLTTTAAPVATVAAPADTPAMPVLGPQ